MRAGSASVCQRCFSSSQALTSPSFFALLYRTARRVSGWCRQSTSTSEAPAL